MSDTPEPFIAVSAKARDIGFLVAILRAKKIPFRQALTFSRKPVLKIPQAYAAPLQAILDAQRAEHPITIVRAEDLSNAGNLFWVMVIGALGILTIAWSRYFIHKFF